MTRTFVVWGLEFEFLDSVVQWNIFLLPIFKTQMEAMELTCQKSLKLHLPYRVLWLVTKSSGYNFPQIHWNLLALLEKTITKQLEHIIFCNTILFTPKSQLSEFIKLQNVRFLHSPSMVCNPEAKVQLLTATKTIIQPTDEKQRQLITKWSK